MNESGFVSRWRAAAPYLLSVLRIVAAFLFIQVGTAKLFAFPGAVMPDGGTAPAGSLPWVAGALEAFGGLFLLLGLFTRPVAFLLSGEMAVAYFKAHAPQGLWPVLNQGRTPSSTASCGSTCRRRGAGRGGSTPSVPGRFRRCRSEVRPFVVITGARVDTRSRSSGARFRQVERKQANASDGAGQSHEGFGGRGVG